MVDKKTTNEARQYFKDCEINYQEITKEDIWVLMEYIRIELSKHKHFPMRLSKIVKHHVTWHPKTKTTTFAAAHLVVHGKYFKKRQAISFDGEDWIGFCGWSDTNNSQPFIEAFIKWCNWKIGLKQ